MNEQRFLLLYVCLFLGGVFVFEGVARAQCLYNFRSRLGTVDNSHYFTTYVQIIPWSIWILTYLGYYWLILSLTFETEKQVYDVLKIN